MVVRHLLALLGARWVRRDERTAHNLWLTLSRQYAPVDVLDGPAHVFVRGGELVDDTWTRPVDDLPPILRLQPTSLPRYFEEN